MKRKIPLYFAGMVSALCMGFLVNSNTVQAASNYTITYTDVYGTELSTEQITEGATVNLPAEADLFAWIYDDCRMATTSLVPHSDMTITAVHNADVSAQGTLDNGNITWFIYDTKLYVTGNGTINLLDKYSTGTKRYGFAVSSFDAEQPAVSADWKTEQAVGDEKTTGWGNIEVPDTERTVELNVSSPISFAGATVGSPSTDLAAVTPWSAYADDITEAYFSDDITLSGNMTFFFNLASNSLGPSGIQESVFSNLSTIYMYADTSGVTRMGGMYARCPQLTQIFVRDGESYDMSAVTDAAAMFYGDSKLLCGFDNSLINSIVNLSNLKDARYMMFGCKSLHQPNVKEWDLSSLEDASFMFAGCNDLGLTCNNSNATKQYDISAWNLQNVYSTAFMFAGSEIDYANPTSNFWGSGTDGYSVITGDVDVDKLNLIKDQVMVYMFANNKKLTSLTLTMAMPVLQDTSGMVAWCKSLANVDMQGFSAPQLTNTIAMFYGSGKTDGNKLFLENASMPSLEDVRYMFYDSGYAVIDLDGSACTNLTNTQGMFASCENLTSLGDDALGEWGLSNVTDASYMFAGDHNLLSIDCAGWGMNLVKDISHMFENCEHITGLNVSGWNVSNLVNMEGAFYQTGLASFSAPNWNTVALENAFMAFAECPNLSAVNISGWVMDELKNTSGMFKNDVLLDKVVLMNSAPNLVDCSGMLMGCTSLTTADVSKIITSATQNAAYLFDGDISLTTVNGEDWNTSGVIYAQAMFRDCEELSSLTTGSGANYAATQDAGCMYKNCKKLTTDKLQAAVNRMQTSSMKDLYETFSGMEQLTSIDLSGCNFSNVTDMTRMLYQEGNALESIKVPTNFASAVTDMATNGKNIFHVGTDTVTNFVVAGTSIPTNLKTYDWSADNRSFLKDMGATINGESRTTYFFTSASDDTALLKENAESTFFLQSTSLPITFTWKKDKNALTETTNSYSTKEAGKYIVTASLDGIKNGGTISKTFTLVSADYISSIKAEYIGGTVPIGDNYDKNDVVVKVYQNGDTSKYTTLSTDDFAVDSLKVTKVGDNTYTVTYIDSENVTWTDEFNVPGKRVIGEIKAVYSGPVIHVGNNYDPANVTLTAYYADDVSHTEGFEVKAADYSGTKVSNRGNNTFKAYYTDKNNNNKEFEAEFVVKGYLPVKSISANYTGPSITVGNSYNQADVIVTLHFEGDISDQTTKEFKVDSLNVTQVGENSYTATFTDEYGTVFTDSFIVKGIEKVAEENAESINEEYTGSSEQRSASIYVGTEDNTSTATNDVVTTAGAVKTGDEQNLIGWISLAVIMCAFIISAVIYIRKVRKKDN